MRKKRIKLTRHQAQEIPKLRQNLAAESISSGEFFLIGFLSGYLHMLYAGAVIENIADDLEFQAAYKGWFKARKELFQRLPAEFSLLPTGDYTVAKLRGFVCVPEFIADAIRRDLADATTMPERPRHSF